MVEEARFNLVLLMAAVLVRPEPSCEDVEDTEPFLEERELADLTDGFLGDWCKDETGDAKVHRFTEGDTVFFFALL
jgi:hypothetical protein